MTPVNFHAQWVKSAYDQFKPAQLKPIFKQNLEILGKHWAAFKLPQRFDSNGKNIYHLKERTPAYVARAKRKNPNWRPLLASSALATAAVFGGQTITTKATRNEIAVTVHIKRGHATRLYVAQEVTKVLQSEFNELMADFKTRCVEDMAKVLGVKNGG
jgi:hypothetical protein